MRRAGKAPGIVYGGAVAPQPIELDHNALFHALRNEAFHSSILTMKLDGAATKVLLRDVQMHPFKNEILHVDFQRIDENRKIHMKVPLHFVNEDVSPAVKISGAHRQPRAERHRHRLPAEGPAGVHRGRPVRRSTSASRCTCPALKLPPGVTRRHARQARPGGRHGGRCRARTPRPRRPRRGRGRRRRRGAGRRGRGEAAAEKKEAAKDDKKK